MNVKQIPPSNKIVDAFGQALCLILAKHRLAAAFLILFLFGFLAYFPSLNAGFQFDDYPAIVHNPLIKHFVPKLFFETYKSRFLTNLTFVVNYQWGGLNVIGWHLVNTLIHILGSFFAFLLAWEIFKSPRRKESFSKTECYLLSLSASLIFLLHPIQTQAVTYIVQRSTSLAALFYLGALYFYIRARIWRRPLFYTLSGTFAILGMLSKPIVVTLPLMIVLYDILFLRTEPTVKFGRLLIFMFFALIVVVVAFVLVGTTHLISEYWASQEELSPKSYLLTQFNVITTYVRLMFLPLGQNLDYDYRVAHSFFEFPTYLSFVAILILIAGALSLIKRQKILAFGILWFFIALSPQSSFFPLKDVIYEHRIYLSSFGFAIALIWLLVISTKNQKSCFILLACVVSLFFLLTIKRNILWSDSLRLMQDVVLKSPNKARPHNNLSYFYYQNKDFGNAKKEYLRSIECDDNYIIAKNNLGFVYLEEKKYNEAKEIFESVVARDPSYAESYVGLGLVYQNNNEDRLAYAAFERALTIDHYSSSARIGRGNVYQKIGDNKKAKEEFERAVRYDPDNAKAHYNFGNSLLQGGLIYQAVSHYKTSLKLDPNFAEAYNNLGTIYFQQQDYSAAVEQFQKLLALDLNHPQAHFNLANALHAQGKIKEAEGHIKKALEFYRQRGEVDKVEQIQQKLSQEKE